jgi:hypothetical protein
MNVYFLGVTNSENSRKILKVLDDWLPDRSLRMKNDIRVIGGRKNYFIEGPTSDGRYVTVSSRDSQSIFNTERVIFVHVRGKVRLDQVRID